MDNFIFSWELLSLDATIPFSLRRVTESLSFRQGPVGAEDSNETESAAQLEGKHFTKGMHMIVKRFLWGRKSNSHVGKIFLNINLQLSKIAVENCVLQDHHCPFSVDAHDKCLLEFNARENVFVMMNWYTCLSNQSLYISNCGDQSAVLGWYLHEGASCSI